MSVNTDVLPRNARVFDRSSLWGGGEADATMQWQCIVHVERKTSIKSYWLRLRASAMTTMLEGPTARVALAHFFGKKKVLDCGEDDSSEAKRLCHGGFTILGFVLAADEADPTGANVRRGVRQDRLRSV